MFCAFFCFETGITAEACGALKCADALCRLVFDTLTHALHKAATFRMQPSACSFSFEGDVLMLVTDKPEEASVLRAVLFKNFNQ